VRRIRLRLCGRCDHDGTTNVSHIGEPDGGTEHSTANLCGTDGCADDGATILATDSTPYRGAVDPRTYRNEFNVAHKRTVNTTAVSSTDHQPNRRADNSRTDRIPDHRIIHSNSNNDAHCGANRGAHGDANHDSNSNNDVHNCNAHSGSNSDALGGCSNNDPHTFNVPTHDRLLRYILNGVH
jgi:hypothetical protein